jgi:hypothetical protein
LNIDKENCNETQLSFLKIFCLHKVQWLNSKMNKKWQADFDSWQNIDAELSSEIGLSLNGEEKKIATTSALKNYIISNTNSSNALLKIYLNVVKSYSIILDKDEDEIEEYIQDVENELIESFTGELPENNLVKDFFERYFTYKGNNVINTFNNYHPYIPQKGKMCAFTGSTAIKEYKEDVAFSMKSRGFSNRTITSLNNTTSHISDLFSEENKLRKSNFTNQDANIVVYNDFFETTLDIDRDILSASVVAKNIKTLEDGGIQFDKNAKFYYNLYNLNFDKMA